MSNLLTADAISVLTSRPYLTILILIGNDLRSDDGLGPYLAARLESIQDTKVVNAGSNPESVLDEVVSLQPKKVVFIDAANFGAPAGQVSVIFSEQVSQTTLSTHMIPLNVVGALIQKDTNASVHYIGVQVKSVALGEGLSPEVKAAADEIIELLKESESPR